MAGKTADNIDELEILTYDGLRMTVGATTEDELAQIIASGGRRGAIYAGLQHIRDAYAGAIRDGLPNIPRRVSGYNLDALLPENGFHVARALVGTESTCALVLEATTRLVHSPPKRTLVVLGYPDIPASGDDVAWLMGFELIACEFTSRHVVDNLHRKGFHFGGQGLLPEGSAWVLVEFGGETTAGSTGSCGPRRGWRSTAGSWRTPPTWWCPTAGRFPVSTATGTAAPSCGRRCSPRS